MSDATDRKVRDWWRSEIIEMEPGVIRYGGYPIEQLIGKIGFAQMIWLLLRGELPSEAQPSTCWAMCTAAPGSKRSSFTWRRTAIGRTGSVSMRR
jgi:citrate synthase